MNYQEALASGHRTFWGRSECDPEWRICTEGQFRFMNQEIDWEFLPIPTAEQLLGAVEKSVVELFTFHSDCVDAVDLDELSFNPGDQVIIMRTPLEHGKVTQEGEK
jgi:hypothetical protein